MMKVTVDRRRLRARMIEEDKNSLIRALKADDAKAAKQALTGMSGEDLGLGHREFAQLTGFILFAFGKDSTDPLAQKASQAAQDPKIYGMDNARRILGVGKTEKQTTATHNPATGQPWSSGPVKEPGKYVPQHVQRARARAKNIILTYDEIELKEQYTDKDISNMNYEKLAQLVDVLQSDFSAGRIDDAKTVGSLILKIIDTAKQVYPNKFKDSDFPDI